MSGGRRTDPEWRAFEKLVARIEQSAAALGRIVRSPDRIRDRATGRLREVDVSIRSSEGVSATLVTVECRKRRRAEDVTWVEQLAAKKASIGADRTIAVSAVGFSQSAAKAAAFHGIELRKLTDITADDINRLLQLDLVLFWHRRAALARIAFRWHRDGPWTVPDPAHPDYVLPQGFDPKRPIFRNTDTSHVWSINDLWHQLQATADTHEGVQKFEPPQLRTAAFPYPGNVIVKTPDGEKRLGDVFLAVSVWLEDEAVTLEDAKKVEYAADRGAETIQRVEFASVREPYGDRRVALQLPKDATDLIALKTEIVARRDPGKNDA